MSTDKTTEVDLRDGYRIEVTPMIMPAGQFGATLQVRYEIPTGTPRRYRWKDVKHPIIVADSPERALSDLAAAMNQGLIPNVTVVG
jgi:hypothetical protein